MLSCGTVCFTVQCRSNFELVSETLKRDHLMKAIAQYFPVVLFVLLYSVDLTFESVSETLKRDH